MVWQRTDVIALVISTAATAALTHTGANGIVLERMDGMTAMRDTVAELAAMREMGRAS